MERKLIRFAKVHGYIIITIMLCSEVMWMRSVGYIEHLMLRLILFASLWLLISTLAICGIIGEEVKFVRNTKRVFIGLSIARFMLFGPILGSNVVVILAVSMYGFYVLHFLEQLFVGLEKRRGQGTIVLTTIVYGGSQPAAAAAASAEQSQPVLPEQNQSASLPPSYETVASMPCYTEQPKEFPTWT